MFDFFVTFEKLGQKESFNFIAKNIHGHRDSKQREGQLYGVYIVQSQPQKGYGAQARHTPDQLSQQRVT